MNREVVGLWNPYKTLLQGFEFFPLVLIPISFCHPNRTPSLSNKKYKNINYYKKKKIDMLRHEIWITRPVINIKNVPVQLINVYDYNNVDH